MDTVRQNIRRLMGDRSVKEVGDGSGVGQSWLQRYLNPDKPSGIQDARHAKLALLASYFEVSVGELTGEFSEGGDPSQSARPDFVKMGNAVTVLREYLEVIGKPAAYLADPELLEAAYEVVEEFGPVTRDNVFDMTKRLGRKIREGGTDEQRQVQGVGA